MPVLNPIQKKFILHWGEMGTRWGINRTVAQIHALLYLADRAMTAEDIVETLSVARSNVSTSLRELQTWGLVRVTRVPGDRRDYFQSLNDVWEMFLIVLDERKRREIEPTIRVLQECVADAQQRPRDSHTAERLEAMLDFFSTTSSWYDQVRRLPQSSLRKLVRMGSGLRKLLAPGRSTRARATSSPHR